MAYRLTASHAHTQFPKNSHFVYRELQTSDNIKLTATPFTGGDKEHSLRLTL